MANDEVKERGVPPFPEDVPTASLPCISLQKLLDHNETEIQRLVEACKKVGLFYLDLKGAGPGSEILEYADLVFHTAVELFDLPLAEKQKFDFSSRNCHFGYKTQGAEIVDQQGNVDRNEFYNVPRNDILGIMDPLPTPDVLKRSRGTLSSMMRTSHSISTLLLDLLNISLGLPQSRLADLHRLNAPSNDIIRLIKAPPQPADDRRIALAEHTDYGSITLVFNRLGGLQVLPPGSDTQWLYVQPLPNTVIINIGEALVKLTDGLLRSSLHRVISPPGEQANFPRYSLVYFCRPENGVLLQPLQGQSPTLEPEQTEGETKVINCEEWVLQGWLARRAPVR